MLDHAPVTKTPPQVRAASMAPSWLKIDLGAVAQNYDILKKQVGTHVDVSGVVKANGYGLGAEKMADTLYNCGTRMFFVATMDEALNLRAHLPNDAKIAMLCGLIPGAEGLYAEQHIIPVLNAIEEIDRWHALCLQLQTALPAILHFDTGMNRLGFGADEAEMLLRDLSLLDNIKCEAIMSHFACADEHDSPMNHEQYLRFKPIAERFPHIPKSLSNSFGIFRSQEYHYDIVRPGMALCGLNPTPETHSPMVPVVSLETRILQIRNMRKGDYAGYGATHRFEKAGKLATVSMGYADGFLRHLGHKAKLYFNGKPCPITGRVSMDLVTVDISHLENEDMPQTGDIMEVLGPHQSADILATGGETIGYEVLTNLGFRYHRQYLEVMTNLGPRYERRYIDNRQKR